MSDSRMPARLAGFWIRVLAQLIDLFWIMPLFMLLMLVGGLVNRGEVSVGGELMANLVIVLVVLSFWAERQATPGKLVLGLVIVDAATGGRPSMGRLVLRYVGTIVSGIPLGLGYLWVLWDPNRQAWHDRMAGTLVVRDPRR